MSRPPWFPFYAKDFAADHAVEAMDTEAVGAYILLLCKAWGETPAGTLPDDDRLLARYSRLSPERWSVLRPQVVAAFTVGTDSRLHQKRMRREAEAYAVKSRKASESAKARWDKEKHANALRSHCEGNARASESGSVSESESSVRKGDARGKPAEPPGFSAWWDAWPKHDRKDGKVKCRKAWATHGLEAMTAAVLAALERSKRSKDWKKDGGAFIPKPLSWLNATPWETTDAEITRTVSTPEQVTKQKMSALEKRGQAIVAALGRYGTDDAYRSAPQNAKLFIRDVNGTTDPALMAIRDRIQELLQ